MPKRVDPSERKSAGAAIIERILEIRHVRKSELAEMLGKDSSGLSVWLNQKLKFDDVVGVANNFGFDVMFVPSRGEKGALMFREDSPCNGCFYKKFADIMSDAMDKINARNEAGTEIDFYAEDAEEIEVKD